MSAARIVTTTERFDEMGKLIERVTEEKFTKECECKCGNRKEKESESEETSESKEINQKLVESGFQKIKISKSTSEILEDVQRMRNSGVPCPFFW